MPSREARQHTLVVTSLDVVIIAALSSALVLFLGARHRVAVGTFELVLPEPGRLIFFAAFAGTLRYWLGEGLRVLPSLPRPDVRVELVAERERLLRPLQVTREAVICAVAAMTSSLIWLTPHILNIRHVPDQGDPIFSAWRLARLARQAFNEPTQLFDGNIFHPARATLTYSDPTLLEGLLALPWIAGGIDPLVVANVLFVLSFPLSALAFFYAGWRLTSDPLSGCVTGVLGGLATFKINHYSHLELQYIFFAPLAAVLLLRALADPTWRRGALLATAFAGQWLASMYLGLMLVVFLVPLGIFAAVGWRIPLNRRLAATAVVAAAIAIAGVSATAVPFLGSQAERGERSITLVSVSSALPSDYLVAPERMALYRRVMVRAEPNPERDLFPGFLPVALAAAGFVPPLSAGTIALAAASAVAFDGSLGTNGLLYHHLFGYLLPFRGMRVPARFAALVSTGLFLLAAVGTHRILRRVGSRRRVVVTVVIALAALFELRPRIRIGPYFDRVPSIYAHANPTMVLAELPVGIVPDFAYMYFSTFHWARLINGRSGYAPSSYADVERAAERGDAGEFLRLVRDRGATHVTVNCGLFFANVASCRPLIDALERHPQLQRVALGSWQNADVRLYAFR